MLATYYQILNEFIWFKTISWDPSCSEKMQDTSQRLCDLLIDNSINANIISWYGNPIVLWNYVVDKDLPTCLFYAHYDVTHAQKSDWWKHEPFSLYIGRDNIIGRWVSDNKWVLLIWLMSIFDLIKENKLWYNLRIVLEWDETIWSPKLANFFRDYVDHLKSDFCLISDTNIIADNPCLDVWYRWNINMELKLLTAKTSLHSWTFGGLVPNAIHEMSLLLSRLYDINNRVTIPYFYYDVESVPIPIYLKNKRLKFDSDKVMQDTWIKALLRDKDTDIYTQIWLKPTVQITGINWWYVWKWFQDSIPNSATVKINFRIVRNQNISKIINSFEQWLRFNVSSYVDYKLDVLDYCEPCKVDTNNMYAQRAERLLKAIFQKEVIYKYSGWALPVLNHFKDILWASQVLVPLANEDCNAHGVNENLTIDMVEKGFTFFKNFLAK